MAHGADSQEEKTEGEELIHRALPPRAGKGNKERPEDGNGPAVANRPRHRAPVQRGEEEGQGRKKGTRQGHRGAGIVGDPERAREKPASGAPHQGLRKQAEQRSLDEAGHGGRWRKLIAGAGGRMPWVSHTCHIRIPGVLSPDSAPWILPASASWPPALRAWNLFFLLNSRGWGSGPPRSTAAPSGRGDGPTSCEPTCISAWPPASSWSSVRSALGRSANWSERVRTCRGTGFPGMQSHASGSRHPAPASTTRAPSRSGSGGRGTSPRRLWSRRPPPWETKGGKSRGTPKVTREVRCWWCGSTGTR